MNAIDIIVCVILLFALIKGWSGGILVQIAGIVGILVGFWAATFCSDYVAKLLNMETASHQLVYIVTLIIIMVVVVVLMRLVDRFLKKAGLSLLLRISGVVFSVGKWVILLSLLLSVYMSTIKTWHITPAQVVTESIFFKPFRYVDKNVFPYLAHAKDLIPDVKIEKKTEVMPEPDQNSNGDDEQKTPVLTKVETI